VVVLERTHVPDVSRVRRLLSPVKVQNAVRRRWFELRMANLPRSPYEPLVHLGSAWSGWDVPGDLISPDWTSYCVGAGEDVSFDLALIERYGCRVRSFDPHEAYRDRALAEAGGDPRFTFLAVAVATEDGPLHMYESEDSSSGYRSAANLFGTRPAAEFPGRSLPSLKEEFGDARIDLLKLDVEGLEYEVLPRLDLTALGVQVLCMELHHTGSARRARGLLDGLHQQGFRLVHQRPPASFTLVRRPVAAHG
jgi:FkbM family methyltransferase